MKIVVTGGAGFVGSHAAEFYAGNGNEVVVLDNLSRSVLLKKKISNLDHNWKFLSRFRNIALIKGDVSNFEDIDRACRGADAIIHAAAQTAVTVSMEDPRTDFQNNAVGTFNVLEAARKNDVKSVVYCSTNKVYGENVNKINVEKQKLRYVFGKKFQKGISEDFPIDLCEHTPYGCSKLTGDLYAQDYGRLYGIKTGVFRMSCIYGTRQFGVEDQGWVAWFTIASVLGKPITIYGDGRQVRDVLYVTDLVGLFDKFLKSGLKHFVANAGGGPGNTMSLLELTSMLENLSGKKFSINYSNWRPSDQKVYISDISKAKKQFDWDPKIDPKAGVRKLFEWVSGNRNLFA